MRILLFFPPDVKVCEYMYGKEVSYRFTKTNIIPPLTLSYLASILLKKGYDVDVLDSNALRLSFKEIISRMKKFKPDIVMFTMVSASFMDTLKWVEAIKGRINCATVVGGIHPTLYPKEVLTHKCIDYIVIGQGWLTVGEMIDALDKGKQLKNVKGIAYRKGGKTIITKPRPPIPKDYKLPFPARQLLPNEKYFTVISKSSPITSFLSSSGCPFLCIYCDIDRNVVLRDPLDVVEEIEECVNKFGIKEIMFYDETFTLDKKRVYKICDEIIKRKIDVVWGMRTRVDCVDRELIFKMAEAGCIRANLGIESGDEHMLKFIKKYIPLDQIKKAVKWCKEAGMDVFGYFMMGLPGESRESIKKTIEFSKQLDLDYIQVSRYTPFPHTEAYEMMKKATGRDFWRDHTLGKVGLDQLKGFDLKISQKELDYWLKRAYREFYFRPSYIFKTLKKIRSFKELKGLIVSAISLMK